MAMGSVQTGGYLPPRKKWMNYYLLHLNYFESDAEGRAMSFKLPDGSSSDTIDDFTEYKKLAAHLPELCDKVTDKACQGPPYDNVTIAMAAGMLNEELKRYDKERKRILDDIRDDFNGIAKEKKKEEKERERKEKEEQKEHQKGDNK